MGSRSPHLCLQNASLLAGKSRLFPPGSWLGTIKLPLPHLDELLLPILLPSIPYSSAVLLGLCLGTDLRLASQSSTLAVFSGTDVICSLSCYRESGCLCCCHKPSCPPIFLKRSGYVLFPPSSALTVASVEWQSTTWFTWWRTSGQQDRLATQTVKIHLH